MCSQHGNVTVTKSRTKSSNGSTNRKKSSKIRTEKLKVSGKIEAYFSGSQSVTDPNEGHNPHTHKT